MTNYNSLVQTALKTIDKAITDNQAKALTLANNRTNINSVNFANLLVFNQGFEAILDESQVVNIKGLLEAGIVGQVDIEQLVFEVSRTARVSYHRSQEFDSDFAGFEMTYEQGKVDAALLLIQQFHGFSGGCDRWIAQAECTCLSGKDLE